MGAIFGGAAAKIVATFMSPIGNYGDNLWYFIMALAIPLGVFGSLTEFWMSGDWRGIPRSKIAAQTRGRIWVYDEARHKRADREFWAFDE